MVDVPDPVRLEIDDGIAHLVLDAPGRSANVMDDAYGAAMEHVVARLVRLLDGRASGVRGVVVRSAKRTFFAGGDVEAMVARPAEAEAWRWRLEQVQRPLRALETCGVPVVALINGAAMGGGLEIALVAHYRVAISGEYPLGLPEVTLGVLAAGGGVSRTVRMLGLVEALESVLLSGRTHRPAEALALGLVDELVDEPADLLPTALAWLEKVAADPRAARRAWDRPGFRLPTATTPEEEAQRLRVLERRAAYFLPEAPRAVLRAAVGGASLDFEASAHLEIEEFLHLASRPELAVTLQATFLDPREVARARRSAAVTAQAAADAERDAGGGRFVARLDAALRAEMARVEGDGVPSHRIAVTCARLGLGDAWLDDQDLRQAVRDDRIVEAIDPEVSDRLLLAVSLEAVAALQDGTVTSVAEANVLSCEGIGFPTVLGGALGHVLHHVRDGVLAGLEGFRQHSAEMSAAHGSRFAIPAAHSAFLTHLNEQESPT